MTQYATQLLYVGAGTHIEPVKHFPNTKLFIFIDTQPRSEFDSFFYKFYKQNYKQFYRPNFLHNLKSILFNSYGFTLDECYCIDKNYYKKIISWKCYYSSWIYKIPEYINPFLLVFKNNKTAQTIKYYISTNIKFNINEQIIHDIKTSDGIIVSGYLPDVEILNYFDNPKIFFGYNTSFYIIDEKTFDKNYDNNIIYFLQTCICNTQYYFSDFYFVNDENGEIIKCDDFTHFKLVANGNKI
jgi:hypothetical protein